MSRRSPRLSALLQALFVTFLWATSFVLIKIGLEEIPPLTFAGLRYALASLFLVPLVLRTASGSSLRTISRHRWSRMLLLGVLLYGGTQGAQFVSLSLLPAVTVNLLWSFSSVLVAFLAIGLLAERPAPLQWLGLTIVMAGALFYFYPPLLSGSQVAGVLVALLGVLANAVAAILGRDLNRDGILHPLHVTAVSMTVGAFLLLTTGLLVQGLPTLRWQSWLIVLWLAGVNTAFAFTLWNHTLRHLSAVESSVINGTMLIWIPILAVIFLGEEITPVEATGLVLAGSGTLLVQVRHVTRLPGRLSGRNRDTG